MAYREQPEFQHVPPSSYSGNHEWQEQHHDRLSQHQLPADGRSRASSAASEGQSPIQQPIKNAIGNAFDRSDSARFVDPDLIAQITAEVKRSVLGEIKSSVLAGATPSQQPVPVSPTQHVPLSPASTSASIPTRDVYTPPSPKQSDFYDQPPAADPLLHDPLCNGDDDTPTPRCERTPPAEKPRAQSAARPASTARMATDDYSPIERMWQRLFDADGQPLPRLGQFLRGLALHLIEDYEPKKTLVIPPSKMLTFYEEVQLKEEIYPWQAIFGKLSYSSLSKVYRDMRCSHHLIQEHPAEQPYIPALTPEGFQEWMTAMIQAYPEVEYERLSKAVLAMPISNADDRRERFPKELPRRLFPTVENLQAQQRCAANLSAEGVGPLRKAPTFPPPPPAPQPTRAASAVPNLERERNPYVSKADAKAYESEDEIISSYVPIERQRQPYTAAPGGGKNHDYENNDLHRSTTYPEEGVGEHRRRTQSTASQWAPPAHDAHHQQHHYTRHGSIANHLRPRSPSFSNHGTSSDPAVHGVPASYYTSNMHDNYDSDGRRHDRHRRSTAGTDSSFESHPRSTYDEEGCRSRGGTNGESRGYESRRY